MDDRALRAAFAGRTVLVTGHSGFKGSWLTLWLDQLGAHVTGLALPPDTTGDSLFVAAGLGGICRSHWVDIRDAAAVAAVVRATRPDIVVHLAGQPLVRRGYAEPLATFAINAGGTAHVLDAVRAAGCVAACVCVTSDKVYAPAAPPRAHAESDPLGGTDPYAASKAAAEHVVRSYAATLAPGCAVASARGGNVLGGGDWAADRLAPDLVRAVRARSPLRLRNPAATRPWQHVLDALHGYLVLAARLADGGPQHGHAPQDFAGAYNIGPPPSGAASVGTVAAALLRGLGQPDPRWDLAAADCREAMHLSLDCGKARDRLGWQPSLSLAETLDWTARWYAAALTEPSRAAALMLEQLDAYTSRLAAGGAINGIASVA